MIRPDAALALRWLPLSALRVTEYQPRYPERVLHYVALLSDPRHAGMAAGCLSVKPCGAATYALLDGHHRYCAYIISGRSEALCLVIEEAEEDRP